MLMKLCSLWSYLVNRYRHSCSMLHLFSGNSFKCVFWHFSLPLHAISRLQTHTRLHHRDFSASSRQLFDLSVHLWHAIWHREPLWCYIFKLQTYGVNNTKIKIATIEKQKSKKIKFPQTTRKKNSIIMQLSKRVVNVSGCSRDLHFKRFHAVVFLCLFYVLA